MRIGLNLLFLIPNEVGGTETYSTSLIEALSEVDNSNQYYLFINKESRGLTFPLAGNFHRVNCPVTAKNRFYRFVWEQVILPIQVLIYRLDVLHSLGYISPLLLSCKSVVTIHDLNFISIPEVFTPFTRFVQRIFVTLSAIRATQIIVVSGYIQSQLQGYIPSIYNKVSVVYEAPKRKSADLLREEEWSKLKGRYNLNKPYLFVFSSLTPHKNIPRLLMAFKQLQEKGVDCQLVVAGHQPEKKPSLLEIAGQLGLESCDVIFTGFLPQTDIEVLLSHAALFVFPSLYEGFGLPALEAMSHGIAVACSNRGSLPEITGKAAILFDPLDINEISERLRQIMTDDMQKGELTKQNVENLKRFSWKKTAIQTIELYSCKKGSVNVA